jgi:hypothetical protein
MSRTVAFVPVHGHVLHKIVSYRYGKPFIFTIKEDAFVVSHSTDCVIAYNRNFLELTVILDA